MHREHQEPYERFVARKRLNKNDVISITDVPESVRNCILTWIDAHLETAKKGESLIEGQLLADVLLEVTQQSILHMVTSLQLTKHRASELENKKGGNQQTVFLTREDAATILAFAYFDKSLNVAALSTFRGKPVRMHSEIVLNEAQPSSLSGEVRQTYAILSGTEAADFWKQDSTATLKLPKSQPVQLSDLSGEFASIRPALLGLHQGLNLNTFGKLTAAAQIVDLGVIRRASQKYAALLVTLGEYTPHKSWQERTFYFMVGDSTQTISIEVDSALARKALIIPVQDYLVPVVGASFIAINRMIQLGAKLELPRHVIPLPKWNSSELQVKGTKHL